MSYIINSLNRTSLLEVLQKYGFFILLDHEISPQLIREMYEKWKDFFHSSIKEVYKPNVAGRFSGLFKVTAETGNDLLYEAFFLNEAVEPLDIHYELFQKTFDFSEKLHKVGTQIFKLLLENFHSPSLQNLTVRNSSSLKLLHYPPIKGESAEAIRNYPHEDIDLLTLLPISDTMSGLEFYNNNQWIGPNFSEYVGGIIVNIGVGLTLPTGGVLQAATHRVQTFQNKKVEAARYSMAYFLSRAE